MDIISLHTQVTPVVPGLKFRKYAGEDDFPAMLKVLKACAEADKKDGAVTLESIERNYRHLVNSDPENDLLMTEINGEMIGYTRVWWNDVAEGQRLYSHFAFIVPAYRVGPIWPMMVKFNETRLAEIASGHDHPDKAYSVWANDEEMQWVALLTENGYEPKRYEFDMVREDPATVESFPMPEGLDVRPVEQVHIKPVFAAAKEAFRDHWGFSEEEWSENSLAGWMEDPIFKPELWKVAWDGDEIAGMILNFVSEEENTKHDRQRGYTETICVRRPWRRRGLAKALLSRSIRMFAEMGMTETALGVDAENPSGALKLYESMGYKVTKRSATYRKPLDGLIQGDKERTG